MKTENKEFLASIGRETVEWNPQGDFSRFRDFEISPSHINKILTIIKKNEWAFIQPKEGVMGEVEGYMIFDGRIGTLLCVLGTPNIPLIPLKSIFPLCRTEENLKLAKQLSRPIREKFESYRY